MRHLSGIAFLCCLILSVFSPAYPDRSETVTLIHSNDIHGIYKSYKLKMDGKERWIGGMEAASHYIKKIYKQEENVLLIDTGDLMTGTLAAGIEYKGVKGGAMIEFMNRLGYDVISFGNHAFDRGQEAAYQLLRRAKFNVINANIVKAETGRLFYSKPYEVFQTGSIKTGVIAVMAENFIVEVHKEQVNGLETLPIIPTLNAYVPVLEKVSDLIVVLVHGKFEEGVRIAREVPGIDVILVATSEARFEVVDSVLVKSTSGRYRNLGYLKVEVRNGKIIDYKEDLIWLWADVELDPSYKITALVNDISMLIIEDYAKIIGRARFDQTRKGNPVESALGNWITDVMRWKTGAVVAFNNTGSIRADIRAGLIRKAHIFEVFPFQDTLVEFKLTGKQIKSALEYDVEKGKDRLQVSGLKYIHIPKKEGTCGSRVLYVSVNGKILVKDGMVLHPEKIYNAVSTDYLAGHAEDKYFGFMIGETRDTGFFLEQALLEWMDKKGKLEYKPEGRIVEKHTQSDRR